jgi:hypothetical protein
MFGSMGEVGATHWQGAAWALGELPGPVPASGEGPGTPARYLLTECKRDALVGLTIGLHADGRTLSSKIALLPEVLLPLCLR